MATITKNELIEIQLQSLAGQREKVFDDLYRIDWNYNTSIQKETALNNMIATIDLRVDSLLSLIS